MDSAVLLSVLAITYTVVLARPADMDLKTKRSVNEESDKSIFNPKILTLPTEIKSDFTITINGTIDPNSKILEVGFPTNNEDEHCRLIYDFETKTLDVLPAPPDESNTINPYEIPALEFPTFSIKVSARTVNQNNMFTMTFEALGGGTSSAMTCPTKDFNDHGYIDFKNGVHSITSILFEFN